MEKIIDLKIVEEPKKPMSMHPKKFAMWLFMASVMMLFMALTSAYIVRRAEGNWVFFELPVMFTYSSIIVALSSITMQIAYWSVKKDNTDGIKFFVTFTFVLGIAFLVTQYLGLKQLVADGHHFTGGNVAESFFYIFPWLHGLHIVSALVFLLIVLNSAFKFRINSKNTAQIEMCTTYWHFLGGLWLYLFVFLILYR